MKFGYFIFSIGTLFLSNAIFGYAIMHHSSSELPAVDIYVYKVDSAEKAQEKHKKYAKAQGVPDTVINVFDKIKGITAPIAKKLDKETEGLSVVLQEGFELGLSLVNDINKAFKKPITDAITHYFRGEDHAFHKGVPRGNRGRFAEWDTKNNMYAIVTLPNSLIPLHNVPQKIGAHRKSGFAVKSEKIVAPAINSVSSGNPVIVENKDRTNDIVTLNPITPTESEKKLYNVVFRSSYSNEYIDSKDDKRNRDNIKELAKTSGSQAAKL